MSIHIHLWLQRDLSNFAEEYAKRKVRQRHSLPDSSPLVVYDDQERGYGCGEATQPDEYGEFRFTIEGPELPHGEDVHLRIPIREVVKAYVLDGVFPHSP